jgi:hypothetical protein
MQTKERNRLDATHNFSRFTEEKQAAALRKVLIQSPPVYGNIA